MNRRSPLTESGRQNNSFRQAFMRVLVRASWKLNESWTDRLIRKLFFTPRNREISSLQNDLLELSEPFEIIVNNARVNCWKWGHGPVLLFVHGWNGRGIQFRQMLENLIAQGYTCITFDGPGHGESEGATSSYFQMSDAVRSLIRYLGPDNITGLIGHSFGAGAVINAMANDSIRLPAILIAPALRMKETLDRAFEHHGVPLEIFNAIIGKYELRYGYSMIKDNPFKLLEKLKSSVLVIHDREDTVIPYSDSVSAAGRFPIIRLHTTSGLGHNRILKDEKVIQAVKSTLKPHEAESRRKAPGRPAAV